MKPLPRQKIYKFSVFINLIDFFTFAFLIIVLNGNLSFRTRSKNALPILVRIGKSNTENKKNAFLNSKFDLLVNANSVLLNKFFVVLSTYLLCSNVLEQKYNRNEQKIKYRSN